MILSYLRSFYLINSSLYPSSFFSLLRFDNFIICLRHTCEDFILSYFFLFSTTSFSLYNSDGGGGGGGAVTFAVAVAVVIVMIVVVVGCLYHIVVSTTSFFSSSFPLPFAYIVCIVNSSLTTELSAAAASS